MNKKDEILKLVEEHVSTIFLALSEAEKTLEEKRSQISSESDRLLEIIESSNIQKQEIEKERQELARQKVEAFKVIKDAEEKSALAEATKTKAAKEVADFVETRNALQKEIKDLEIQKKSFSGVEKVRDSLLSEIEQLKVRKSVSIKDMDAMDAEIKKVRVLAEKEKESIKKEIAGLEEKRQKELSVIMPKISDIEAREKKVKEDEKSLKILKNRLERLYNEKGLSFRM